MWKAEKFKGLTLLKTKSLRNFSILNILIIADNQELGSPFHPFAIKTNINRMWRMYQVHESPKFSDVKIFGQIPGPFLDLDTDILE